VDDGSSDGSSKKLEQVLSGNEQNLRIINHAQNRGYGASLKTGIHEAKNELIGITDADGTYPIEKLPMLLEKINSGARMAVGARPVSQQPFIRRPAKVFLNKFASYLSGVQIPDINSGLRVFYKSDALANEKELPNAFSFTSTITMILACEGHKISYVPIQYKERIGESKIRPMHDLYTFTLLILRLSMAFNPLKTFIPVSASLIGLSCFLLILRFFLDEPIGIATTIVLFVAGIQMLATGLVADLINRKL